MCLEGGGGAGSNRKRLCAESEDDSLLNKREIRGRNSTFDVAQELVALPYLGGVWRR